LAAEGVCIPIVGATLLMALMMAGVSLELQKNRKHPIWQYVSKFNKTNECF
jgi:hypothetical protein